MRLLEDEIAFLSPLLATLAQLSGVVSGVASGFDADDCCFASLGTIFLSLDIKLALLSTCYVALFRVSDEARVIGVLSFFGSFVD